MVQFAAPYYLDGSSQNVLDALGKGPPGVAGVNQNVGHSRQITAPLFSHSQCSGSVSDVSGCYVHGMGQAVAIHGNVPFNARHLLARVVAFFFGGIRVLDTLGRMGVVQTLPEVEDKQELQQSIQEIRELLDDVNSFYQKPHVRRGKGQ